MTPNSTTNRKYHVALSFAGEDREYVDKVAMHLRERKIPLFYDKYEEVELWGKDLYQHLSDVYSRQAHFTVMFISKHYKEKLWTNHERRNAQARAFEESREYILPVRFDETEIPGILKTVGYLSLNDREPKDLARLVEEKLASHNLTSGEITLLKGELSIAEIIRQAMSAESISERSGERNESEYATAAAANYVDHCHHLYQNMRILAMPKPVELSHIFTQVRVADRIRSRQSASEMDVIKDIVSSRGGKNRPGLNAMSLFSKRGRSVLSGGPGSGKSTFLKYMLLRELQSDAILQIPALLPLNELDQRDKSIFNNLVNIFDRSGIPYAESLLQRLLRSGRLRLLIDGLDELRVDDRARVVKEIEELMTSYKDCSFLITCRTAAYEFWFGDCLHYEVQRFSRRSITAFVLRWFSQEKKKARELLLQVLSSGRMRDLCSSPLMLTIVCIGFDAGIDLSNNRAEIYKDAVDALLRKWDASRSIYRDNVYRTLTPKRREDLLCDLAARTFVDNQIAIPSAQARELVSQFLKTMPTSPDISVEDDAEVVLQAIETQHGLIERRSVQFWAFSHLTFQEFFVAQYLATRDPDLRSKVAATYIDKPEWREVIMLTAALLPNADDYVLEILRALTSMGYGEFFVKQTMMEIRDAQRSSDHKKFQSENVFPRKFEGGSSVKFRTPAFGVIEGGTRFTVEEIQLALIRFRASIGTGGSAPNFQEIIDDERTYGHLYDRYLQYGENRKQIAEAKKIERESRNSSNDEIDEETSPEKEENLAYNFLRRIIPNILVAIEDGISEFLEGGSVGKGANPGLRIRMILALLSVYPVFERENANVAKRLGDLCEPKNLFELPLGSICRRSRLLIRVSRRCIQYS